MEKETVIIIGAGASGLIAARELAQKQQRVIVLEARDVPGGRIRTFEAPLFSKPLELGAEFIHSNPSVTLRLLHEYGIEKIKAGEKVLRLQNGELEKSEFIEDRYHRLEKALKELTHDISVDNFLLDHFGGPGDAELTKEVRMFVQGYDAADTSKASALAFRDEWLAQDKQFRIEGSYSRLVEALRSDCAKHGCEFHFSTCVQTIGWKAGEVNVLTTNGTYTGSKALITLPLGLLRLEKGTGAIRLVPPLPAVQEAGRRLGYGAVIKLFLQFTSAFWTEPPAVKRFGRKIKDADFFFADTTVPTWWTHKSGELPMLTGWLGGPAAQKWSGAGDEAICYEALRSLSVLFQESIDTLATRVVARYVSDWGADPFSRGAYSYKVVGGKEWQELLRTPVENTLYFAGEALAMDETGTVEAALLSGLNAVAKMGISH